MLFMAVTVMIMPQCLDEHQEAMPTPEQKHAEEISQRGERQRDSTSVCRPPVYIIHSSCCIVHDDFMHQCLSTASAQPRGDLHEIILHPNPRMLHVPHICGGVLRLRFLGRFAAAECFWSVLAV